MKPLMILAAFALAACTTEADVAAYDQGKCAEFGFQPGTVAFSNCLMQQDQQRRARYTALQSAPYIGNRK